MSIRLQCCFLRRTLLVTGPFSEEFSDNYIEKPMNFTSWTRKLMHDTKFSRGSSFVFNSLSVVNSSEIFFFLQ